MMLRPVVAWPSATLSATSFRPGYFAASCSLKPLWRAGRASRRPADEVMSATSPSALPYLAVIASARPSAAMRPPCYVVGGQERGEGLRVGRRIDADDRHFLRRFVDRFAERLELGRRDDDRGGLLGDGVLEDRNLAGDVGFRLGAEFWDFDAEVFAGLARARQHDLPVSRRGVLDDDRELSACRRRKLGALSAAAIATAAAISIVFMSIPPLMRACPLSSPFASPVAQRVLRLDDGDVIQYGLHRSPVPEASAALSRGCSTRMPFASASSISPPKRRRFLASWLSWMSARR